MFKIRRRAIQFITAIGINSYFIGFIQGNIYKGNLKNICLPGLNCSSCPGALVSCPLALLQTGIAGIPSSPYTYLALGFLVLTGVALGRFACGWFCPFGLIQELIFKIPATKVNGLEKFQRIEYLKYVILIIFVISLPALGFFGSSTAFCRYLCPVEVLEANFPLMMAKPSLLSTVGFLFKWKLFLLAAVLLISVFICKPFCRYICPLGAIYSLFNRISLYRFQVDLEKCTGCSHCQTKCPMDIPVYEEPNHRECMRCNECLQCSAGALGLKGYSNKPAGKIEI
ncbi:MAG: 4Fe-4S binding protein [Syntrophomonadaceae bacterium]|nr:4Fe-4S binding protein [Syntrophomonadaceae bacterium]